MNKKVNNIFVLFITVCILFGGIVLQGDVVYGISQHYRIFGSDRYKTALAISRQGWDTSDYAVIARGDDFADALCAGPLAKKHNAPILLTRPDDIDDDTLSEIKRLNATHVLIIGGTGAVSYDVENKLRLAGIHSIERIYGSDRYETSVKIAEKLGSIGRVFAATGEDYPDALSASVVAAKLCIPILLTEKERLPGVVEQYIGSRRISKSYVLGGTGVVSERVKSAFPNSTRIGGRDRYETNVLVMHEFSNILSFNQVFLAAGDGSKGNGFSDALTGSILAARESSPVILVYKTLSEITKGFIKSRVSEGNRITAFGGEVAVPSSVIDAIASIAVRSMAESGGESAVSEGTENRSQSLILSWREDSGPSGYKYAGEEVDIGINIDPANSGSAAEGIDLVLLCRKELQGQDEVIGEGDITVNIQDRQVALSDDGLYYILQSVNIDRAMSVNIRTIFKYPGNYKLNVYAVRND